MSNTDSPVHKAALKISVPIQNGPFVVVKPGSAHLDVVLVHTEAGVPVLRVSGEIDMGTASVLRDHVEQAVTPGGALVLDFTEVGFLASAGLAILVDLSRRAEKTGLRWCVVATGRAVLRPLEAVGLLPVVLVYPTVEEAAGTL